MPPSFLRAGAHYSAPQLPVNTFSKTFFNASETALPGLHLRDLCLESGAHYKHHLRLRKHFLKVLLNLFLVGCFVIKMPTNQTVIVYF